MGKAQTSNPGVFTASLNKLYQALKDKPPGGSAAMVVESKSETLADLSKEVEGYYDVFHLVETTATDYAKAVEARTNAEPSIRQRVKKIRQAVKGALGANNPDLKDYGIQPDKPRAPLTTEQQTKKNAQNAATRAARHTMGSQQKKASDFRTLLPGVALTGIPLQAVA